MQFEHRYVEVPHYLLLRVSPWITSSRRPPDYQVVAFPWGWALARKPHPMVPCASALQLARRPGSFFKLRRRVVARVPRLLAETRLVTRRLRLVWDKHHGQSESLVETRDAELLASGPRAKPALGKKGVHPSLGQRPALIFPRVPSWRPSRIPP